MARSTESIDDFFLLELRRAFLTLAAQFERLQDEVARQVDVVAELKLTVAVRDARIVEQAEEIARLKGLPPRPKFVGKPSGMEQATSPTAGKKGRKPGRRAKRDKLSVTDEVVLKAQVPPGSRFKGYEDVLVRELQIKVAVVRYRRERWLTPSGRRIVAPLPPGILGGFGPELRRFIAAGHFQGQVTAERLTALLNGMGLEISKRQVVRLISRGLEGLACEDQAVLEAGLETARWITVDDTSARHAGRDGHVTTQLGDRRFAAFRTGSSKSRGAFLSILQAGREDFLVDEEALAWMRRLNMAAPLIGLLAAHPSKRFSSEAAWAAHLKALGLDQHKALPNPVKIATEAALWGAVKARGLLAGTVIVSDGAGQFCVADHALCWVHAERLIYKLQPTNPAHRKAVELTRSLVWWFYRDLKAYKQAPDPKQARMMRARFDRIFGKPTGYILLDRQLARLRRRKAELLRVLDRPEIPLHTNGSENDIRSVVTKRKISGGTVSEAGKTARDVMLGLMKTCAKLNVSFYQFLGDRFGVDGAPHVPSLPKLVRLAPA